MPCMARKKEPMSLTSFEVWDSESTTLLFTGAAQPSSLLSRSNFSSTAAENSDVSPAPSPLPDSCHALAAAPAESSAASFLSQNDNISRVRLAKSTQLPELSPEGHPAKPRCLTPAPPRVRSRFRALARFPASHI